MFPPFRMTWPLTGHVLAPVNGFHVSIHVFTDPEVLGVDRARSATFHVFSRVGLFATDTHVLTVPCTV